MSRSPLSPSARAVLSALLALAGTGPVHAQQPEPIQLAATTMVLPARRIELKELIDAAAKFLQVNVLCDERELQQARTFLELQSPMSVPRADVEATICDLLFARGFLMAPRDGQKAVYDVIYCSGPRRNDIALLTATKTPEEILRQPTLKQPVTTVMPLQHINGNIAGNALRPFFAMGGSPWLTIGSAGTNQSILFTGLQSEVAKAIQLVQQADVAPPPRQAGDPPPIDAEALNNRLVSLEQQVARLTVQIAELLQRLPK